MKLFLDYCKANIEEINYVKRVIDDSQMSKDISDLEDSKNLLLYGVLPDYNSSGSDADAISMGSGFDFLILKKNDDTEDLETIMGIMQECFEAMEKLLELIKGEAVNQATCYKWQYLDERSIQIDPVWKKSGTDGYMLTLNLLQ